MQQSTDAKSYTDAEVLMVLRRMARESSLRKTGASLGVSGAYIHDVLKRRRGLSIELGESLGFTLIPPPAAPKRKWNRKPKEPAKRSFTSRKELE